MEGEREKLQLDWVKVLGAALAAMSSAVLLSTLGAAGTIIGAALGSVVITVGGSVYSHYLDLSRGRVAKALAAASRKVSDARSQVRRAATELDDSGESADAAAGTLAKAEQDLHGAATGLREAEQPSGPLHRETLKGLPWKRIALVAAGVFLVAMTIITVFELVSGRAVSSYTGGSEQGARTSITGLAGGGEEEQPENEPRGPDGDSTPAPTSATARPTTEASPTDGVTEEPSDGASDVTTAPPEPPGPTPAPTATEPAPSAPVPTAPAS